MKVAIVSGSHRTASESGRVARYVESVVKKQGAGVYLLDLAIRPLPFWDDGMWSGDPTLTAAWSPIKTELLACDSVVLIAAEWGGMVPAALKNFLIFATDGSLYHKPSLLVGVSSSRNGAYPIAELRMSGYKNSHLVHISEHVIVRDVNKMLHGDTPASEDDGFLRKRFDYGVKVLLEYGKALKQVRESGVLNRKDFPNGM